MLNETTVKCCSHFLLFFAYQIIQLYKIILFLGVESNNKNVLGSQQAEKFVYCWSICDTIFHQHYQLSQQLSQQISEVI